MDREALVCAYLDHAEAVSLRGDQSDNPPAWDEMFELVHNDPETAWAVVLELIRRAIRDEVLAYIAAGPLEDLLCLYPRQFIDRTEALAVEDPHFRRALSGVWGWTRMPEDVLARIDAVLGDEPRL